jgi:hypothetical protein
LNNQYSLSRLLKSYKMTKLNLIFTFDYELPLGGCKSFEKGLFDPSERLLKVAKEKGINITLFTDICSAMFFEKWDRNNYYIPFRDQVKKALSQGNDIQLHIHPHWLTSKYADGQFFPSNDKILGQFQESDALFTLESIIENSCSFLNHMCSTEINSYKCVGYRGGGYNISPATDRIMKSLNKSGIKYDSSIIPGYYYKSDIQEEDYRNVPDIANWRIGFDGNFNLNSEYGILEIPVASMPITLVSRLNRMVKKVKNKSNYHNLIYNNTGKGLMGRPSGMRTKFNNFIYSPMVLTFDSITHDLSILEAIIKYNIEKFQDHNEIVLCLNSHPKSMGDFHFKLMEDFIDLIQTKYVDKINIITFNQIPLK